MDVFAQALISGVINGSIYALIGLGLAVVFRGSGVMNVVQGEYVVVGVLLGAVLLDATGLPYLVVAPLVLIIVTVLSVVIHLLAIEPLIVKRASADMQLLMTLALAILSSAALLFIFGRDPRFLPGIGGITSIEIFGGRARIHGLVVVAVTLGCFGVVKAVYDRSILGHAMLASALDETGARTTGIDVRLMRILTFALGGVLAGISSLLIGPLVPLNYLSGLTLLLKGFAAAILGGLTNPMGALVGGIVFGLIESLSVVPVPTGYRDIIALSVLIVVLLVRPQGLFGVTLREEER